MAQPLRLCRFSAHRPVVRSCKARLPAQAVRARFLSTEEVTDDHIAELAAQPLHPLTLGDLVK
jgi:hypothetical protein